MPNELHKKLDALLASIGFNDGANKGFWRFQPREKFGEDAGQWIEMGAELRMFFKNQRGKTDSVPGKAVGSTGNPNGVRVLVQGQSEKGVPDGIYGADTANVRIAKGIIPEETLRKQGIKSAPKISREQEANLPTIDSLERADITDGDIRLINEGAESKEAKQQAEYKKSVEAKEKKEAAPSAPEKTKDPIAEVMADVAYNGDTDVKVDDLVESLKKADTEADSRKSDPSLRETKSINLEKGDVIRTRDGKDGTVLDVKLDLSQGGQSSIRVQNEDGSISNIPIDPAKPFYVVKGKKGKVAKPAKPAKPAAPEVKTAPVPEKAEKPAPAPSKPENTTAPTPPRDFPPADRIDDNSEFEFDALSPEKMAAARKRKADALLRPDGTPDFYVDENGKLVPAEDPFSLMAALASVYPNAKFTSDGLALVLARQKDKDGRIFELRASNAGQKAVSYSMRWTDPNTGEIEELIHYDTRHSITSLFTKTNGADGLLERLMGKGKWANLKHGNSKWGPNDSLRERANWFVAKQKMKTADKMAVDMAAGRTETYHTDTANWGRVRKSEIKSVWEAVDALAENSNDPELRNEIYLRLEKIFGSIPMTDEAHKLAMTAIRAEFKKKYTGKIDEDTAKTWNALVTNASMHAKGKSFSRVKDPAYRANPYASKDRHTPLKEGMVVLYENNVGDTSVLRVLSKVQNTNSTLESGESFDYKDTVVVVDANGNRRTINSIQLQILKDQGTSLTEYKANLNKNALTRRRIEQGKLPGPSRPASAPMPGSTAVLEDLKLEVEGQQLVDDLIEGDVLLDRDGESIGEIIAVEPTQDNEGNEGFAFLVVDDEGDEIVVFYPRGTEIDPKKD